MVVVVYRTPIPPSLSHTITEFVYASKDFSDKVGKEGKYE